MNTNRTIEQLKSLKLPGMADAYQSIESLALHDRPDLDQCIARMVEAEIQYRTESKMKMYLKLSNPQSGKYPDQRSHRMRKKFFSLCPGATGLFNGV